VRKHSGDYSGAAQAARCVAYANQCHRNVEPIRNHDENRWLAPMLLMGRKPLASADAADGTKTAG